MTASLSTEARSRTVLALNAGSATSKLSVFDDDDVIAAHRTDAASTQAATHQLEQWCCDPANRGLTDRIGAIGHRIVHGGRHSPDHQPITDALLVELDQAVPLDPLHMLGQLALVRACARLFPGVPQVACFDTAFFRALPSIATALPIPRAYQREGLRRHGFHGLSYESLLHQLDAFDRPHGRLVLAHLGSGASMTAVRDGRPLDTTMGLTPTSGLMMATRPGDLDPGVMLYLMRTAGRSVDDVARIIDTECGLRGVSETSGDMRLLLATRPSDPRAGEAIALYCHLARKAIGALATVLGGVDTLVFAGGVGEHAAAVRAEICAGLGFLGVELDPIRNARDDAQISTADARTAVRVLHSDEELMIARHVRRVLAPPTVIGSPP